eukprot:ANDGO_06067.mRNA.1 ABC transporter C family member 12
MDESEEERGLLHPAANGPVHSDNDDDDNADDRGRGLDGDGEGEEEEEDRRFVREKSPEESASLFSILVFGWMNKLISLGYERTLQPDDLYPLKTGDYAAQSFGKLLKVAYRRLQNREIDAAEEARAGEMQEIPDGFFEDLRDHPLQYFHGAFGKFYYLNGLIKFTNDIMVFLTPLLVFVIISYLQEAHNDDNNASSTSLWVGLSYVLALFVVMNTQTIAIHHHFARSYRVSFWVESSLITAIYQKALRLRLRSESSSKVSDKSKSGAGGDGDGDDGGSAAAAAAASVVDSLESADGDKAKDTDRIATVGEIVNRMSVDANRVGSILIYAHALWSAPFQTIFSCWLLFQILGAAAASAGIAALILMMPLNLWIAKIYSNTSDVFLEVKDERTKFISEVIKGIQAVKYYAWETRWRDFIMQIRKREFKALCKASYVDALSYYISELTPVLVAVSCFGTYVAVGNDLNAPTVFAAISVLEVLKFPISMIPWVISSLVDSMVSLRRITKYLECSELDALSAVAGVSSGGSDAIRLAEMSHLQNSAVSALTASTRTSDSLLVNEHDKYALVMKDCKFTWNSSAMQEDALASPVGDLSSKKKPMWARKSKKGSDSRGRYTLGASTELESEDEEMEEKRENGEDTAPQTRGLLNSHTNGGASSHARHSKDFGRNFSLDVGSLSIPHGSLVYIVGSVGSGKSSLLHALFGEMHCMSGSVTFLAPPMFSGGESSAESLVGKKISSAMLAYDPYSPAMLKRYASRRNWAHKVPIRVSYSTQNPWLENATVKDNILFGHAFDQERFNRVIEVCSLASDIAILPAGIQTEIGEHGVNLSGGQKARISLARAIYADADVYLLDCPLAAVDSHVASHIHEMCFKEFLHGKTCIMATHALQYSADADMVIRLDRGHVVEVTSGEDFAIEYREHKSSGSFADLVVEEEGSLLDDNVEEHSLSPTRSSDRGDGDGTPGSAAVEAGHAGEPAKNDGGGKLVKEEERQVGGVRFAIIYRFFRYVGWWLTLIVFASSVLAQGLKMWGDFFLAAWTNDSEHDDSHDTLNSLMMYGMLGLAFALCILIRAFLFYTGALHAATGLHDDMLNRVLRAPLSFFQSTPSGRLLNRFAKDQMAVDWELPASALSLLSCLLRVAATAIVICVVFPFLIILFVPVFFVYMFVQRRYRKTVLSVKRIESTARSPIYSHFSTTLAGMSVIRCFGHQRRFEMQNQKYVDHLMRASYLSIFLNRWLGERLEFIGNGVVVMTALFAILRRSEIDAASAGLALTYALSVTGTLNWLIRMLVTTESAFTSVERIIEYTEIAKERDAIVETRRPPGGWPSAGRIELRGVCIRYRPGLPLALNHVSLVVNPGEKIGVVGRTGSGKSTLVSSLFRLVEPEAGNVFIDGVDICKMGLDDLRSRITIIPQDPVIFSGTIRMNLDPFQEYPDDALWAMLEAVQLKQLVAQMPNKLEQELSESGSNLSVGESQLLCLARALLRKSRVFVQDEASANIDYESDRRIQVSIRRECSTSTVLTIAHRLETIMDSDRILVLEDGRVAEFDKPSVLASDPNSKLYGLIQATGPENAAILTSVAKGERRLYG